MYIKTLLYTFFALIAFNLSAQEMPYTFDIENNQVASLSTLDLSEIADTSGFDFYSQNMENSLAVNYTNTQNLMLVENQDQAELENYLNMMLMRRHPMEKTGRILTYIGVPLAIIGGIMVAGADELSYQCVNGDCTGDARGGFGVVLLGAGSGLSITGAVLWIIGSKK